MQEREARYSSSFLLIQQLWFILREFDDQKASSRPISRDMSCWPFGPSSRPRHDTKPMFMLAVHVGCLPFISRDTILFECKHIRRCLVGGSSFILFDN